MVISEQDELWDQVDRACNRLVTVVVKARGRIYELERSLMNQLSQLSPEGHKALSQAKRLLLAIDKRFNAVNELLRYSSRENLELALKILNSPLELPNDAVNCLISEAPTPPIEASRISDKMDSLLKRASLVPSAPKKVTPEKRVRTW